MFSSPDMSSVSICSSTSDITEFTAQLVLTTPASSGSSGTSLGCSLFLLVLLTFKMLSVCLKYSRQSSNTAKKLTALCRHYINQTCFIETDVSPDTAKEIRTPPSPLTKVIPICRLFRRHINWMYKKKNMKKKHFSY